MQASFDFLDGQHVVNSINEYGVFVDAEDVAITITGSQVVKIPLSCDGHNWYYGVHITLESQGMGFNPRIMTQSYPSRAEALAAGVAHVSKVCTSAGTKMAKEVLERLKLVAFQDFDAGSNPA